MSNLRLRKYGDPILRRKAERVENVSSRERDLLSNMAKIMYENEGIGLAAPQIGVGKRIIVVDTRRGLLYLINPNILESEGENHLSEGCLSLPEIFVPVSRATAIKVEGLNEDNKLVKLTIEGFLARVIQHEVDHLNGVLIIDYATEERRKRIKDNLEKIANHTRVLLELKNRGRMRKRSLV